MSSSAETPLQSRQWKNSFLSLPKKPSQAALSGPRPLADMLLTRPAASQMPIHSSQR